MDYRGLPNGYPQSSRNPQFNVPHPLDVPASSGAHDHGTPEFDIFGWHQAYQSCQKYFLDHAQHEVQVQALAALVNICLPFQWPQNPVLSSTGSSPPAPGHAPFHMPWPRAGPSSSPQRQGPPTVWVSLVPYIRRLVVTGFDQEPVLHGFFGDDWKKGVGSLQECERRNFLFAAKSVGWAKVKFQYDMTPHETVPFIKPLQDVQLAEIEAAEKTWSQWLAMEDWMVGPRAPEEMEDPASGEPEGDQPPGLC